MTEIIGKSVLILGYGLEGRSVHRWLKKFYPRLKIGIADSSPASLRGAKRRGNLVGIATLPLVARNDESFIGYDTIVKSPGIPANSPTLLSASVSGKHITSATNIFFSVCPGKIIGVTGTKGKSTTAALIAKILIGKYPDVRLVGNIGSPALDHLEGADKNTLFVMEISSYQLEDSRYSPHIAVILDIVPEHLDRYQSFENYAAAKSNIVKFQTSEDYVVYNPEHKIPARIASQSLAQKVLFSPSHTSPSSRATRRQAGSVAISSGLPRRFAPRNDEHVWVSDIPLLGQGNLENCLAAAAAAKIFLVSSSAIRHAIKNFKPLPHRLENIGEYRGITFYDDSIATIPQATIHALDALGEKVATLLAGGFDRGLDYTELGKFLVHRKGLKNLILFPDTGAKIWQAILAAAGKQKIPLRLTKFDVSSMEQAVGIAFAKTGRGKICLLSPAAASYNLFQNFEERGKEFKKRITVRALVPQPTAPVNLLIQN